MPKKCRTQRGITINCHLNDVLTYVSDTRKLPTWSNFFRKELGLVNGVVRFDTPIGECLTKINTRRAHHWAVARILSRFEQRNESALIQFNNNQCGSTIITFYIVFPPDLAAIKRTAMLKQLEHELEKLKQIVEQKELKQ